MNKRKGLLNSEDKPISQASSGRKLTWKKSILIILAGICVGSVVASFGSSNNTEHIVVSTNSTNPKNTNITIQELNKTTQMQKIDTFVKSNNINKNSKAYINAYITRLSNLLSSQNKLNEFLKINLNNKQYQILKDNVDNIIRIYNRTNDSNLASKDQKLLSAANLSISSASSNTFQIKQILENTADNLSNLSSQLTTQKNALAGTAAAIATVLGIMSFFDFGTTAIIAGIIAVIMGTVRGVLGDVIASINGTVSSIEQSIQNNNVDTDLQANLSEIETELQDDISQLNNAVNQLSGDTWVIGVNNAISEIQTSISELQQVANQVQNSINAETNN